MLHCCLSASFSCGTFFRWPPCSDMDFDKVYETILFLPFKFNLTSVIGISTPFAIIVCFSFNLHIQPEFMPLLQVKPEERVQNPFSMNSMETVPTGAQIGISIEPLDQLAQQTPAANATPSTLNSFVEYTQKMLENFFNFASSFAITQAQMTPNPSESFVPFSVVQKWYDNYQRKMKNDPNFWKRWFDKSIGYLALQERIKKVTNWLFVEMTSS